ncbi:hypothetical protein CDL12_20183 [Handroanthus impetiginosus]|uniref:Putative plant transposon protein domain-containing protein n=1 Tax=Handroanthus impetiginosus TaxID=429701 RepID=A0A2G9GQG3_9LAMI|nr:hypothetical protein CDL12_20183 [Handroanthus impetiginosus]
MKQYNPHKPSRNAIITARKWESLVKEPDAAVIPIVREFYANLRFTDGDTVLVRGRKVSFSRVSINDYFGVEEQVLSEEEFNEFQFADNVLDHVPERICGTEEVEWSLGRDNNRKSFKASLLTRESRNWLRFISSRMLPTTHLSDVSKERAILIYAIYEDVPIDLGFMINDVIKKAAAGGARDGLPFPHLITSLCFQAGVQWDKSEELLQPDALIIDGTERQTTTEVAPSRPHKQRNLRKRLDAIEDGLHVTFNYLQQVSNSISNWFDVIGNEVEMRIDARQAFPPSPPNPFQVSAPKRKPNEAAH